MVDAPTLEALTGVAAAALVTGILVEVIKRAWNPDEVTRDRWVPLLSVLIGVIVVLFAEYGLNLVTRSNIAQGIITGIIAGWTASGAYSVLKGVGSTVTSSGG